MHVNPSSATRSANPFIVDGFSPREVASPTTSAEVAETLREASAKRLGIIPVGGGTKLHIGNLPRQYDLAISIGNMRQVVDFDPENLTVTAEAGMRFAELQEAVREQRQFVPIDPPLADQATAGGIAAASSCGPRRFAWKSPRDLILGMEVALPNGDVVKLGGKVVKNVAGFDAAKLFVGSFGSLGVITTVTFKTMALPQASATIACTLPALSSLSSISSQLLSSYLTPTAIVGMNAAAAESIGFGRIGILLLAFQGFSRAVARQMDDCARIMQANGGEVLHGDAVTESVWTKLSGITVPPAHAVIRCSVPLTTTAALLEATQQLEEEFGFAVGAVGWMGSGTVYLRVSGDNNSAPSSLACFVKRVADMARAQRGRCVAEVLPVEIKREFDVWTCYLPQDTQQRPDFEFTRRIKDELDPHHSMCPGRWLGRL